MTRSSLCALAGLLPWSAGPAFAQPLNDAQIASIVVTANQVDIDAGHARGRHVEERRSEEVRGPDGDRPYGRQPAGGRARQPGSRSRRQDNETSQSLKAGGEKNVAALKALKGAAFDKAYVDHEVAYHQAVLDAVDKTLIPNAKNEELRRCSSRCARRSSPTSNTRSAWRLTSAAASDTTARPPDGARADRMYRRQHGLRGACPPHLHGDDRADAIQACDAQRTAGRHRRVGER